MEEYKPKTFNELSEEELAKVRGDSKRSERIDDLMGSFVINSNNEYENYKIEIMTFAENQFRMFDIYRRGFTSTPHNNDRKSALIHVANCANALDKALSSLVYGINFVDLRMVGTRLEKRLSKKNINLPDFLFIDPILNVEAIKKYCYKNTKDETPCFAYKKMNISKLLKSLENAARKADNKIPRRGGGPITDDFRAVYNQNCLNLFMQHTALKGRKAKDEFRTFMKNMNLLIFADEEYPLNEIRQERKAKRLTQQKPT